MTTHQIITDEYEERQMLAEASAQVAEMLRRAQTLQASRRLLEERSEKQSLAALAAANRLAERMTWRPVASIALVHVSTCQHCGTVHRTFQGFGVLMRQDARPETDRLVMHHGVDKGLPQEVRQSVARVEACISCLPDFGFEAT